MYIMGGDEYCDDRECARCSAIFEDVQMRSFTADIVHMASR